MPPVADYRNRSPKVNPFPVDSDDRERSRRTTKEMSGNDVVASRAKPTLNVPRDVVQFHPTLTECSSRNTLPPCRTVFMRTHPSW